MDRDLETRVLDLARSRGLIDAADVAALDESTVRDDGSGLGPRLLELLRSGRLSSQSIGALLAEIDPDQPDLPTMVVAAGEGSSRGASRPGSTAPPSHLENWERYRVEELIGEGGMGRVYRALDPRLGRAVAIKFLRGDEPAMIERFLREARTQARIEHENVCAIFEVGDFDGRPYLAMPLIVGTTLDKAAAEMSLEQKVLVFRRVAEGVHEAHRLGLVHRDIKPANVMVERLADGGFRPYVMDFGLAREVAGANLTATGLLIGTPAYMAPEQARGESRDIDRRTDVYSLGATLFAVLTGRPPFDRGSSVDVLLQLIQDEPPAPRSLVPSLPVDLEAIVLRCLEKDPTRRYDSARALADDLGRWLDGEPVAARRAGVLERFAKKARKHRLAFAAGGIAVLGLAGGGTVALRERLESTRRAAVAADLERELADVSWRLRVTYALPLHDVSPARRELRTRLSSLRDGLATRGAEGAGHAALGLGELALGRPGDARRELEAAWNADYRTPAVERGLGLTMARLYRGALIKVERLLDPDLRERQRRRIESELRDPALEHLRRAGATSVAEKLYAEALIAACEGKDDAARSLAQKAFAADPSYYTPLWLVADVARLRGNREAAAGRSESARAAFAEAEQALVQARDIGRSDPLVLGTGCELAYDDAENEQHAQGGHTEPAIARADQWCRDATTADPSSSEAFRNWSGVHRIEAEVLRGRGADPLPALDRATELARAAIAADAGVADGHTALGSTLWVRADYESARGNDAVPLYDEAIAVFEKSLALEPDNAPDWSNLGIVLDQRAFAAMDRDEDPRPYFDRAIRAYQKAIELHLDNVYTLTNLGVAYIYKGKSELRREGDARASLDAAVSNLRAGLEKNPRFVAGWMNLGVALDTVAEMESDRGDDPRSAFAEAATAYQKAIEIQPDYAFAYANLAYSLYGRASDAFRRGEDPTLLLTEARGLVKKTLTLYPGRSSPLFTLLEIERLQIKIERRRGGNWRKARAPFLDVLTELRKLGPTLLSTVEHQQASLASLSARYALEDGAAPAADLAEGRAALVRGAKVENRSPASYTLSVDMDLTAARAAAKAGRPDPFAAVHDSARALLKENPDLAGPLTIAAEVAMDEVEYAAARSPEIALRKLDEWRSLLEAAEKLPPGTRAESDRWRARLEIVAAKLAVDSATRIAHEARAKELAARADAIDPATKR